MTSKRADGQLTGMAGEFLCLGKLFKRGYQASVTFGNAKAVDILVYNADTHQTHCVQVKTLRKKNCFPMKRENLNIDHIYVFILLNDFDDSEEFYILRGNDILADIDHFFGASYRNGRESSMPAINYGPLKPYRDNWVVFD